MATNVPTVTFGSNGFSGPSTTQILTGVIADIQEAFDGNLNLSIGNSSSLATPQGQWAISWTAQIQNSNNAFLLTSTQTDPAYAYGKWQDAIGRIYFMSRNPAEPTALQVACNGAQNVEVPVGYLIKDQAGNIYSCTQAGTIDISGSITLSFAAQDAGPIPVPQSVEMYQTIPGLDSVALVSGVQGKEVESRADFEQRREDSVAGNSFGAIGSIIGAVAAVPGVLDYFGFNNNSANPTTVNGVTIPAYSIYICVAGGAAADIGAAILSKKGGGAPMFGNTTVTVFDNNPRYSQPVAYEVTYEVPTPLQVLYEVTIANGPTVPSNAEELIQAALIAAFSGSTLSASFTGSISGTILTVTEVDSGTIVAGQSLSDLTGQVTGGTTIVAPINAQGGIGTYEVSVSQNVASEPMTSASTSSSFNIPRARINSTIFAVQYVPAIAALGFWAQVVSIKVGSINQPDCTFQGYVSSNTLTVTSIGSGEIVLGEYLYDTLGLIPNGTQITSFGTGSGGVGTYTISNPLTFGATFTGAGSGTNLTASAVTGVIEIGSIVTGTGIPANTKILSQTSGTPGGAGVYVTSAATTVNGATTSTVTITGVSADHDSVQVQANQEPQLSALNIVVGTT